MTSSLPFSIDEILRKSPQNSTFNVNPLQQQQVFAFLLNQNLLLAQRNRNISYISPPPDARRAQEEPRRPRKYSPRPRYSDDQLRGLENAFKPDEYLNKEQRIELANALNMTPPQVSTWLTQRRTKHRKQMMKKAKEQNYYIQRLPYPMFRPN